MEGQNILYGNVSDIENITSLVIARDKVRNEIASLTNEKQRLEKDVVAEEKQLSENIDSTLKKRREQVVSNFDKELGKSQDRLKKVRNDRGKAKNKKIAERIKEETAGLVVENKNLHEEIRTYYKQKGVPVFLDNTLVYSLYFPRCAKELIILALTFFIGLIVFPSVVVILSGVTGIVKIFVTLFMMALFLGAYVLGYNYTRVRNKEAFSDMLVKHSAVRKNEGKISRIKKNIKKDKDEDQYGLHEFDEDIEELEEVIGDIVKKKNEALSEFEKSTKADIVEEITNRDMPKIEKIKKEIAETSLKLKELEQKQKDMSINLSTNYGAYIGEENMNKERLFMLEKLITDGQASNIGEAVNIIKNAPKTPKI